MLPVHTQNIQKLLKQVDCNGFLSSSPRHLRNDFTLPPHVCFALPNVPLDHLQLRFALRHWSASFSA
jgi:hypothetical protein